MNFQKNHIPLSALLQKSKKELASVAIHPHQESLWILSKVLNLSPSQIYRDKESVDEKQGQEFLNCIQRRKKGEPLEYILREKIFYEKSFYTPPGVFIPRQETELLVDWVLKHIPKKNLRAVDFGAGSGALSLSLASLFPDSLWLALEICKNSIHCLKKNCLSFQLEERFCILQRDVDSVQKEEVRSILGSAPRLITANPPYIDSKDESLCPEVGLFEPPLALFSDQGGMGHIISWFEKAMELLESGGVYIFEFGWNQGKLVRSFLEKQRNLDSFSIHKDQQGHPRMAVGFKK